MALPIIAALRSAASKVVSRVAKAITKRGARGNVQSAANKVSSGGGGGKVARSVAKTTAGREKIQRLRDVVSQAKERGARGEVAQGLGKLSQDLGTNKTARSWQNLQSSLNDRITSLTESQMRSGSLDKQAIHELYAATRSLWDKKDIPPSQRNRIIIEKLNVSNLRQAYEKIQRELAILERDSGDLDAGDEESYRAQLTALVNLKYAI